MPQAWYSIKMSGLHSSSLCMEYDEASAMYANIILAFFLFFFFFYFCSCCDKHSLTGWARADRGGPACQSGFVQEPCAKKCSETC